MANDLKTADTPAPEMEEKQVRIRGQMHTIRVPKGLTDDEIKRRLVAKSMQPSQSDFGTDVGYGVMEGVGAVGARQLGERILTQSGVIQQAPAAPGAGQEGVVTEAKVPSAKPEGLTPGRLIGNVMGGAGMGGAIGAGLKYLPQIGSMGRAVAGGAIPAALQPVDEDKDFWKTKTQQAGTGVALGYGFSVLGKAANVGTSALLKWLAPRAPGSTEDVAVQKILDRINMGSKYGAPTTQQIMELLERARAQGKPMTVADVGDKNLLSLAGHVARSPGAGRQIAENFLTQRNDAAFERLLNDTSTYIRSGPTARQTVNVLSEARSAASRPLYERTDALQGIWSPRLEEFVRVKPETMLTPAHKNIMAGIRLGYEMEANVALGEGRPFDPTMMGVDLDNEGNIIRLRTPNMRVLDMGKRGLDAMISKERDPITGSLSAYGRTLVTLRKGYLEELDALD